METLWVESYRPKSVKELSYHSNISNILAKLAENADFPHLLFYGPNGAGKKTRIMAFLKEIYGSGVYSVNSEEREFKQDNSSTTATCTLLTSKYHIDVTPSDAENQDKLVVQKLIKEVASSHQLNNKLLKEFKVVVINEVDNLSKEAQASLRRTMEKYIEKCRLILCCESLAKVIHPIRSRCLLIRVPAPSNDEITSILRHICDREQIEIPDRLAQRIAQYCDGNLREAILTLQSAKIDKYPFTEDQKLQVQEWKVYIEEKIANPMINQQTPEVLKEIRDRFYDLIVNCIPPDRIIKELLECLLNRTQQKVHYELIAHAADVDNKMKQGSKAIFHLEAFAARCMVVLKRK